MILKSPHETPPSKRRSRLSPGELWLDEDLPGRFRKYKAATYPNYYVDLATGCQGTVSQYRVNFLSDWKARWDRYAR